MRTIIAAWALLIIVGASSPGQSAKAQLVRTYLAPDSFAVGERITLVVVAEHALGDTVSFPSFRPEAGQAGGRHGDLVVFGPRGRGRTLLGPGYAFPVADTIAYEVTTFALDSAFVPQVSVDIAGANGRRRYASDPFFAPVQSTVPPGASTLRDISPIAPFRRNILPILAGLLALIGGAWLAKRWFDRPRTRETEAEAEPVAPVVESPIAEAMRRLQTLEETDPGQDERLHAYFVELADTLRTYLERKLGVPALERTTRELDSSLAPLVESKHLPDDIPGEIRQILEQSDLAKFARQRYSVELSKSFVVETRVLLLRIEDQFRPALPSTPEPEGDADDAEDAESAVTPVTVADSER